MEQIEVKGIKINFEGNTYRPLHSQNFENLIYKLPQAVVEANQGLEITLVEPGTLSQLTDKHLKHAFGYVKSDSDGNVEHVKVLYDRNGSHQVALNMFAYELSELVDLLPVSHDSIRFSETEEFLELDSKSSFHKLYADYLLKKKTLEPQVVEYFDKITMETEKYLEPVLKQEKGVKR